MRFLFTFFFFCQLLSAQVWVQLPDFPGLKRDDGVAVVVNNKAYFGTGLVEWAITLDFYVLDLNDYSWSYGKAMPDNTNRQYACAFSGPGCFYVFGGDANGGATGNMFKYDIAANTWTAVASKPGNGLIGAACMNFGNKVIISGGRFQSGKASAEVWEYTLSTDTWVQKNDYPFPGRWRAGATVHNNAGYLIFGRDTGGAFRKEFYKYTPASDSWSKIMDFPAAKGRAYSSLQVANTKLCVFGGTDTLDHFYKDIWYYNETTNTWLQGPDLPSTGRKGGMSCAYGENLFYTCGIGEGPTRLTETWKTDIPLGVKENHRSTVLSVYPNPSDGLITIGLTGENLNVLNCSYEDLAGRVLGTVTINSERNLDLRILKAGIYILKFYSENRLVEVKKIVKN